MTMRDPRAPSRIRKALDRVNQLTSADPRSAQGTMSPAVIVPGTVGQFLMVRGREVTEVITEPGDGTWHSPAGVTSVRVRCKAGSGAGGQHIEGDTISGGGGGGGAYAEKVVTITPDTDYSYHNGARGYTASDAENTTWNGTTVVAAAGKSAVQSVGGLGGLAADSTGDIVFSGGDGGDGFFAADANGAGGGSAAGPDGDGTDGADGSVAAPGAGGLTAGGNPGGGDGGLGTTNGNGEDGEDGGGGGTAEVLGAVEGAGADGTITLIYTITEVYAAWQTTIISGLSSGTSGGIPYFSSSTTLASSAALTAGQLVVGGGAGAAPSVAANTKVTGGNVSFKGSSGHWFKILSPDSY